jgi:hypothetical protein
MPEKFGLIPCTMRAAGSANQSRYVIKGKFYERAGLSDPWVQTMDDTFYTIYGVNRFGSAGRLATGIKDAVVAPGQVRSGTFGPLAATEIAAVELAMNADAIVVPGPATGGMGEPQCGLGQSGYVFYQNLATLQTTPKVYVVMNASIVLGGCGGGNLIYDEGNIVILPDKDLDYHVRIRSWGTTLTQLYFTYKLAGTYGQPEYLIERRYNTGGFETSADIHPENNYLEFKVHLQWQPDQTVVFRWDVEVTPVATRRIDIDSLALYNVCPRS